MSRNRALSVGLLTVGAACLTAGMFVEWGFGAALITAGVLLIAADFLVPTR